MGADEVKRRPMRRRRGLPEYSKRVIAAMIVLWFAGALFGAAVVIVQLVRGDYTVALDSLLNYIGLPMGGGVVSYLIKSAIENKQKIKEAFVPDYGKDNVL